MTFAAEEVERVWEEEEEEREISLGLVDWTHHRGAKKKKRRTFCLAKRKTDRKRERKSIGQRLDAEVFLMLRQICAFTERILF